LVGVAEQLAGPHFVAFRRNQGEVVRIFLGQRPEPEVSHDEVLLLDSIGTDRASTPVGQLLEHVLSYCTNQTAAPGDPGRN
jgi:hypothetical protein